MIPELPKASSDSGCDIVLVVTVCIGAMVFVGLGLLNIFWPHVVEGSSIGMGIVAFALAALFFFFVAAFIVMAASVFGSVEAFDVKKDKWELWKKSSSFSFSQTASKTWPNSRCYSLLSACRLSGIYTT